jgi:hypothetical protein
MAKDADPFAMNDAAKQMMAQANTAVDSYFDHLKQTISATPSGGNEFGEKLKGFAEKNVATMHDFFRKLSQARDLQEITRLQSEFMQTQLTAFGEQSKSLGEAFTKAASDFKFPMKPGG